MTSFAIFPPTDGLLFEDPEITVRAFHGGCIDLNTDGTLFFAVVSGRPEVNGILLREGMYGCLPRIARFESENCRVLIAEAKHYHGIFSLGGPIEPIGRLRYINGCTDTGLIQPVKQGDPCLNALFFPSSTLQTPHTHPSHRIGTIFDGEGECLTENGPVPMRQGDMFIIPTDVLHWFHTTEHQHMRIMVFHPDSEFGPTDEHHQMLDATLIPA